MSHSHRLSSTTPFDERPLPDSHEVYRERWQRRLDNWKAYLEGLDVDAVVSDEVVAALRQQLLQVEAAVEAMGSDATWREGVPACHRAWQAFITRFESVSDQLGTFENAARRIGEFLSEQPDA